MYMKKSLNKEQLDILELLYNVKHQHLSKKDSDRLATYEELDDDLYKSILKGYIYTRMVFNLMKANHKATLAPLMKQNILALSEDGLITPLFTPKGKFDPKSRELNLKTYLEASLGDFGWDSVVAITSLGEKTIENQRFIKSLTIVKTSEPIYDVIVNEDYGKPAIRLRKSVSKWKKLYELATSPEKSITQNEQKQFFDKEFKAFLDYMNYRPTNPLYSRTKLALTKILKQQGAKIVPAIKIESIDESLYQRRRSLA